MKCKFCEKEVIVSGEPSKIYTGNFYQSYSHIDNSVAESKIDKVKHTGYASKVI